MQKMKNKEVRSAEQRKIMNKLRQVKVDIANGKTVAFACKEAEITEQTYYRWREEYRGWL